MAHGEEAQIDGFCRRSSPGFPGGGSGEKTQSIRWAVLAPCTPYAVDRMRQREKSTGSGVGRDLV